MTSAETEEGEIPCLSVSNTLFNKMHPVENPEPFPPSLSISVPVSVSMCYANAKTGRENGETEPNSSNTAANKIHQPSRKKHANREMKDVNSATSRCPRSPKPTRSSKRTRSPKRSISSRRSRSSRRSTSSRRSKQSVSGSSGHSEAETSSTTTSESLPLNPDPSHAQSKPFNTHPASEEVFDKIGKDLTKAAKLLTENEGLKKMKTVFKTLENRNAELERNQQALITVKEKYKTLYKRRGIELKDLETKVEGLEAQKAALVIKNNAQSVEISQYKDMIKTKELHESELREMKEQLRLDVIAKQRENKKLQDENAFMRRQSEQGRKDHEVKMQQKDKEMLKIKQDYEDLKAKYEKAENSVETFKETAIETWSTFHRKALMEVEKQWEKCGQKQTTGSEQQI